ncbi:tail fiber domain-containing protein [Bacteroidota bacterium]
MKKLFLPFVIIVFSLYNAIGQVPERINYQGVLRNSSEELIENTTISLRISLLEGSATGTLVFSETHSVSTNDYGQFSIQIGAGTLESGDFSTVNWASGAIYLKTEVDETGTGSSYSELPVVQLITVPYAMYANDVANKDDADADSLNEVQDISLTGTDLSITSGSTVDLSVLQDGVNDADSDPTNEYQILSISDDTIYLTNGGFVKLPVDNINDADADPSNEIQDLDLTSNILTITNHTSPTEIDLAPFQGTNTDEQTLSLTGTDLSITGGNTVDMSPIQDGVDDADADPTNEYQILSISNDTIYLENGGYAKLPVDNIDDADANPTNEIQSLLLVGDTLELVDGNKVVLPYDSSKWIIQGNTMYYNDGNVGIGSSTPVSNLEVKANVVGSDALFQVINANNDTVFAVYPDGVKVFVDPDAKGKVGGFAISGRSPAKAGEIDYMRVTSDSTRIYVNEPAVGKGKVGGFAISGRSPNKGVVHDYLVVTNDSTRIYVNDTATVKGKVGGFAISGRSPNKGTLNDYLKVTRDSTRVYVTEDAGKGKVGGFAISGRSPAKGVTSKFMDMTKENYFIGHESGQKTTEGKYNSFIGYRTGYNNTEGNYNTFLGDSSGIGNTTGSGNLFVGKNSGISNDDGNYNSFIGYKSGSSNSSGINNSFIGSFAGYKNTSGSYNTYVGDSTGFHSTDGASNTFVGTKSGLNNLSGSHNVFIGEKTGYSNGSGKHNVLIGFETGFNNYGSWNVFLGYQAGYSNKMGGDNVFIGEQAGYSNNSGSENLFIGELAGYSNTSGFYNVFLGHYSGEYNETGRENTFVGNQSGNGTIGNYNTFIGHQTGQNIYDGNCNTFVGTEAGRSSYTSNSVFIGYKAGYLDNNYNRLYIANDWDGIGNALIYGEFDNEWVQINDSLGIGRIPVTNQLEVEGTASKATAGDWLANSDARIKTNIREITNAIELLEKLHPVVFNYTDEYLKKHESITKKDYYNFIAQEYQKVFPESVKGSGEFIEGDDLEILQIDTYNAQIVTIKAVQELVKENQELKEQLIEMSDLYKTVLERLDKLEENKK